MARDIGLKTDDSGDTLSAGDYNAQNSELENALTSADFTLDPTGGPDSDLNMLGKTLSAYANAGATYVDSGTVNSFVLSLASNLKSPNKYYKNLTFTFKAGTTNTGSCVINVSSLGSKNLTKADGTALVANDIVVGNYVVCNYNETDDRVEIVNEWNAPTGAMIPIASELVPAGSLEMDGSNKSRTTFARLFAVIGTKYGEGDGSTTFTLPDGRGKHFRGWDHGAGNDPDAATRTAQSTGGATGDNVGSIQPDAGQRIKGTGPQQVGTSSAFSGVFLSTNLNTANKLASGSVGDSFDIDFDSANSVSPNPAKTSDYQTNVVNFSGMWVIKA